MCGHQSRQRGSLSLDLRIHIHVSIHKRKPVNVLARVAAVPPLHAVAGAVVDVVVVDARAVTRVAVPVHLLIVIGVLGEDHPSVVVVVFRDVPSGNALVAGEWNPNVFAVVAVATAGAGAVGAKFISSRPAVLRDLDQPGACLHVVAVVEADLDARDVGVLAGGDTSVRVER